MHLASVLAVGVLTAAVMSLRCSRSGSESAPDSCDDHDIEPVPESVEAPSGFERVEVAGVASTPHGHAVVLTSEDRALPIVVGETEGLSIELRLLGGHFHRPLTHDLVDAMLVDLGGHIESVRVEREERQVFYSVIVLRHECQRSELDARTSDAIALALGNKVPIFVSEDILDHSGIVIGPVDGSEERGAKDQAPPRDNASPPDKVKTEGGPANTGHDDDDGAAGAGQDESEQEERPGVLL